MRKILFLIMLLIPTTIFAAGDINVSFEQPGSYKANKGENLEYILKINLPENFANRYREFAVTILMDPDLEVGNSQVEGTELIEGEVTLKTSNISEDRTIITFVAGSMEKINSNTISIKIPTTVKVNQGENKQFENSFVLTYTDKDGVENSSQKNVTTGNSSDENLKVEAVYSNTDKIVGTTKPGSEVTLTVGGKFVGKAIAQSDGVFNIFVAPFQVGTTLEFSSDLDGEKSSTKLIVIDESQKSEVEREVVQAPIDENARERLIVLVDLAKSINISSSTREERAMVNAAIAQGEYIAIKRSVTEKEVSAALDLLVSSIKAIRVPFMSGYTDGTFKPNNKFTRAEAATVITKMSTDENLGGIFTPFTDVDQSKWYADNIGYAARIGAIKGYDDGKFKPEKFITRAEFATMVVNYANLRDSNYSMMRFKDVDEKHWAYENIAIVYNASIMRGKSETKFAPDDEITRQEVAVVINKLKNRNPNKAFINEYSENPFKDVNKKMWSYYEIMEVTGS